MSYADKIEKPEIIYYDDSDIITINGVNYSGELFRSLALAEIGTWLRICERRDGTLTIHTVPDNVERTFDAIIGFDGKCK